MSNAVHYPHLPVIGYPEAWYAKHIEQADKAGDVHAMASYKVGRYITLATQPNKTWEERLKCYSHAYRHYGIAPADADPMLKEFYHKMADIIHKHAGQMAVKLARAQADAWSVQLDTGSADRESIEDEAAVFFTNLLGHSHDMPEWCCQESWRTLSELRERWIG